MMAPENIDLTIIENKDGDIAYRVSTIKIREENYETMVFPGEDGWREVDVEYTDCRRLAKDAHAALVRKWTDKAR